MKYRFRPLRRSAELPTMIAKTAVAAGKRKASGAPTCYAAATMIMLFFSSMATVARAKVTIYVALTGHNRNSGTIRHPVRTLRRARNLVRAMNHAMAGNIVVHLAAGTYRLTRPLMLWAADSGTNGKYVVYEGQQGARVIISGAVRITGWKRQSGGKNIWVAKVPGVLRNTRQLYINGVRALRTRGRLPVAVRTTATGYIAGSSVMSRWKNQSDIDFVYTGGNGLWSQPSLGLGAWTQPQCPVQSIVGRVITMAQPCWNNSTRRVRLPAKFHSRRMANLVGPGHVGKEPAYAANVFEFLGTPGQWYLDRPTHTLYYTPRAGENLATADVEAPLLQKLIVGHGTPDNPVHNIMFSGIQFSYATWLFPSSPEGFSEIQANYMVTGTHGYKTQGLCHLVPHGQCPFGVWTQTPGNVSFTNDHHIQFIRDAFVHLGAAGLQFGDGSQFDTVKGCVLTDISANGVELGNVDMPEAPVPEATRNNVIEDNHIYNVATQYHGGAGIDVGYAANTLISHNQLNDLPYTAISLGWGGWLDKIKQAGVANNSHDNVVAHNLIFDHMLTLADGGGIYTQGLTGPSLAQGEKLLGNVIYNQYSSGHALYTDNGCNNVTAEGNVIFHTNFDNWGGRHRDYYNGQHGKMFDAFRFENNYWQQGTPDSSGNNVTLRHNHLIYSLRQVPQAVLRAAGIQKEFRQILLRQFGASAAPEPPMRVAAWAGNEFAYVAWNPPVFQGSSPILGYTVTASNGNALKISSAAYMKAGYIKFSGLPNGTGCRFTVTATNAAGTSPPSIASADVTPSERRIGRPGVPQIVHVGVQNGQASVQFRSPRKNGGAPITHYVLKVLPGGKKIMLTGRTILVLWGGHTTFAVIPGLRKAATYHFDLAAINAAGRGEYAKSKAVRVGATR